MTKPYRVLITNGGSTSTKVAVWQDQEVLLSVSIPHPTSETAVFKSTWDQYDYRKNAILKVLDGHQIPLCSLDALITRGGNIRPVEGGTYLITELMLKDMKTGLYGSHPCCVCNQIAFDMGKELGIPAMFTDPPMTDELCDEARFSGMKEINRIASFHALSQKATARKICRDLGLDYQQCNLIVIHMGGGISVGAHHNGKIIDVNNALDGDGPFSPERAGSIPTGDLIRMCYSGNYTQAEMLKKITGKGGLVSYLSTSDCLAVEKRIAEGDEYALRVYKAMAYQTAKEIGSAAAVLKGQVDGIAFTGSLAYSKMFVELIRERVGYLGEFYLYPGENEMEALGEGALRVLKGEEKFKEYPYSE